MGTVTTDDSSRSALVAAAAAQAAHAAGTLTTLPSSMASEVRSFEHGTRASAASHTILVLLLSGQTLVLHATELLS
jgi:hypothetical protein